MSDIEQVMLGHDEFESVYTRTGAMMKSASYR